ncbi:MAG: DUF5916 domain-containing protein [Longimicrobiales bacterium]
MSTYRRSLVAVLLMAVLTPSAARAAVRVPATSPQAGAVRSEPPGRPQADGRGEARPPALHAERVEAPPTIDGRVDEAIWARAEVATGFTQMRPDPGAAAEQRTEVRVLYDDAAIYVAARLHDTAPDSVVAQLGRRDSQVFSDWFFVGIDSYFDRRTAFAFGINPRGVLVDVLLHNDTEEDVSWDAVWEGAARQDGDGWTAEFRIPLSQLRFSPSNGADLRWGINFRRSVARTGEESFWAPVLPDDGKIVSLFGELRGLRELDPPRRLEVMPYALASATAAPGAAENPFYRDVDPFGGVGADLKAGITSDLTLTATINPDFGQVEADPSVVNLTAFETFFPEKRPFFVEGVDIFRFGIGLGDGDLGNESLFYSRRIGRAPQGSLDGDYTRAPDATTILAAAKLSGKTAGGWSIGVLDALTANETGQFVENGMEGEAPIEPLTNYGVARVIKDFRDGRSAVGGILTSTHRSLPGSGELDWLRREAYTGGLDVRHRFADDAYTFGASLVGSRITGTPEALDEIQTSPVHYFQRPDADHLEYDPTRTSLQGFAAKAELFKVRGNWRFALFGITASPGFEANDLGFQTNSDMIMGGYWVGYQQYEPGEIFRSWNIGTNAWGGTSYGREVVALGGNVNGGFQLNSFWGGNAGLNVNGEAYSPSLLRGGPSFLRPASWSFWSHMYSDRRETVSLNVSFNAGGQAEAGGGSYSVSPGITVRPSNNVDLTVGPSFSWNRNALQYVNKADVAGASEWLLGTVEQTTVALTGRLNYTFSPTLSLQLYAQPFISAGDYSGFKVVADPGADAFGDRVRALDGNALTSAVVDGSREYTADLDGDGTPDYTFGDPSFNFKQLRSNVVLRWEYRPGSALFLVWSQGRTDFTADGRFRFDRDVGDLWSADGTNVLMVKVSYWLGL